MADQATPTAEAKPAAPEATNAPQAKQQVLPGTEIAPPAPDYAAELKAAQKAAQKAERQAKELEARAAASDEILAKLKGLFSPETKDPLAEVNSLRDNAARLQLALVRSAREAAAVRFAAIEGAHDAEDVASAVAANDAIEVDAASGRVKDPEQVAEAVRQLKAKKPHWFRQPAPPAAPSTPAPIAGRLPQPSAPSAPAPQPLLNVGNLWALPMGQLRNAINGRKAGS